jgi:hypothetical protein
MAKESTKKRNGLMAQLAELDAELKRERELCEEQKGEAWVAMRDFAEERAAHATTRTLMESVKEARLHWEKVASKLELEREAWSTERADMVKQLERARELRSKALTELRTRAGETMARAHRLVLVQLVRGSSGRSSVVMHTERDQGLGVTDWEGLETKRVVLDLDDAAAVEATTNMSDLLGRAFATVREMGGGR